MTGSRLRFVPALVVIALQLPYPLVHGHARDVLTIVTVLVFAIVSMSYAIVHRGLGYAAVLAVVAGVGGFLVEVLGVHTGVPFGSYRYDGGLGPAVLGVPVIIGLAWLMMAHPCVVVAERVVAGRPARIGAAAIGLAGWDVFLDPQMVEARHWHWSDPSPHLPGVDRIPLSNFGGWLLVALVMSAALVAVSRAPASGAERPVALLWIWVWLSSALAALAFFHHRAVAGWGLLVMGLVGVPLLRREVRR
ncbi:MAG: hypothetical protein QOC82_325 [Frankiaceae bacterium]|jgi:putative membrane protein|nr:hypothetical protein [Frankiaceae bacterium]